MRRQIPFAITALALALGVLTMAGGRVGAGAPTAKPEEVGLSADRLTRITALIKRHIDARNISGGVTLVARNGRVAHFEAQGLMHVETSRPMQKDTIFRIMSMTKPVVGAA